MSSRALHGNEDTSGMLVAPGVVSDAAWWDLR